MISKARFYLEDDEARKAIARAGRERCINSRYSMRTQLDRMLGIAFSLD